MSETNEQKRMQQQAAELPVSATESEASMPVTHAHVHEHADGTVHSHYHTHPGGDVAHEHAAASHDEIAFDQGSEAHASGAIPEHSHATTTSIKPPLEACDLAYAYPRQEHPVFSGLSFHVHPASMLAILGNNGAGKSTLLDLLAGITKAAQDSAAQAAHRSGRTSYEAVCEESQAAYDAFNPHKHKEA